MDAETPNTDEREGLTPLERGALAALTTLSLPLQVHLGSVEMSLGELLELSEGSIVALDRDVDELVEVVVGDAVVARGELVAVDDEMGVRITEIAAGAEQQQ